MTNLILSDRPGTFQLAHKMSRFQFTNEVHKHPDGDAYVAVIGDVNSKDELLRELSNELSFPDYFGHNWDALLECLNDFHWIDAHEIVLIHSSIPDIGSADLKIYLDILSGSVGRWKDDPMHRLTVIFREDDKEVILNMTDS